MMKIVALSFLVLFVDVAVAQKKEALLPMDQSIRTGKLSNGLTFYIRKNQEPKNRAELRLVVNAGSVLESDKQVGLAHFVEHMSFNGTEHFRKQELVNFLEKNGVSFGADLNASTSFDETIYELQVPTDSPTVYKQAMQILEDWAHNVSFEPEEIDKERGVIVEEWRLGRGADARLRDKYFPVLLKGSQYAKRIPIGTKANIDTAHYGTLTSFYKDWYRPDLQAVIVVGDVDVDETEKMIRRHFEHIPAVVHPKPRTKYTIPPHAETRTSILTDAEQPYNVVQVYYTMPQLPATKTASQYRADIIRELFNQMMSGRLDEIGQKPGAPFLFASSSYGGFIGDKDAFNIIAVAKTGKDILPSIKTVLLENERVRQYGFQQTELDRAVKNVMARVENEYNERDKTKSADLVQELIDNYLKGEAVPGIAYEFGLYKKFLPSIKLAEVNSLIAQWIKPTGRSVVITGPEKEKANLPRQAQVLAELNKPFGKLKTYTDKIMAGAILPVDPEAGKIVAEKKYDAIGVTEWTLSNGARVVLKPTNFKNDDVQFSAISWGGTSLYSDSDYLNAVNATTMAVIGGMGTLDMQSLQKEMAGKNCYVVPGIVNYMQGLNGSSTPKDLGAAMQLLHGYFVATRKDSTMFRVVQEQLRTQLINKDKDPASVFGDSVSYIMGDHHFRRKPFELADIGKIDPDRSLAIFRERFSNAGQFVFTFVGSFHVDSIRTLVEKYIASLPSKQGKETWRDVGLRTPKGRIEKVIRMGKENKASVRLFFTGSVPYDELDELQLSQLARILSIRLREILREDAGGVYGVGVSAGISREPDTSYSVSIQFGCAPENVDKLVAMVWDEIRNVKTNGASQTNIGKIIAEQTRSLENDVKENSYWRFRLEQQFFRGGNPLSILNAGERLKMLNVERTRALANKYLDDHNFAKFVLLPGN